MLFKFGKFWQTITFLIGSWITYGIFGFEFATITLLSLIMVVNFNEKQKFI
mgnify:CR=1 FL=1|jgi:hypothetical protein